MVPRTFTGRFFLLSLILTVLVVAGQIAGLPGEIWEPATGMYPTDVTLGYPITYTVFAPFLHLVNQITMLGAKQHLILVLWLNIIWAIFRFRPWRPYPGLKKVLVRIAELGAVNAAWLALLVVVLLVHLPSPYLKADNGDAIIVDFHSHTSYSHDGRKSFTPARNLDFHLKSGFNATYITDHNLIEGAVEAVADFRNNPSGVVPLRGEEVSLAGHWVVLGNDYLIDRHHYQRNLSGIKELLQKNTSSGSLGIFASLPEYWRDNWEHLENFVEWGLTGFEICNGTPKGFDFPVERLQEVISLCRRHNLPMIGATDNHGWGLAVPVWNLLEINGWQRMDSAELHRAIRKVMDEKGFEAVRVLQRVRAMPTENAVLTALDPFRQAWVLARSIPLSHALISLVWIWLLAITVGLGYRRIKKGKGQRANVKVIAASLSLLFFNLFP